MTTNHRQQPKRAPDAQGWRQQPHTSVFAALALTVGMLSLFIGTVIWTLPPSPGAFGGSAGLEISGVLRYWTALAAITWGIIGRIHVTRHDHLTGGLIAIIGVIIGVVGLYLAA